MFKFLGLKSQDNDESEKENRQLRQRCKNVQKENKDVQNQMFELQAKYIALLEEKGEGFNQYLKYYELYESEHNLSKEQKKEIATLKEQIKDITAQKEEMAQKIAKLEKKIKKESEKQCK